MLNPHAAWKDRDIETALKDLRSDLVGFAKKSLPALDAEDAVQLCIIWCWEKRADFRGSRKDFRAWVYKVMNRVILDTARRVKRRQDNETNTVGFMNVNHTGAVEYGMVRQTVEEIMQDDPTVALIERLAAEPEREQLWELIRLSDLSERQVEVLTHTLGDWTQREIAERMGMANQLVSYHYVTAIRKIRDAYQEQLRIK